MTQTTQPTQDSADDRSLHVALELSKTSWKLAFSDGCARRPRVVGVAARDWSRFEAEVATAKQRFGQASDAPVRSCYEAGRDGFWIHRALGVRGVENVVVDAASIEVNCRPRRAKTDRLDAVKLVTQLGAPSPRGTGVERRSGPRRGGRGGAASAPRPGCLEIGAARSSDADPIPARSITRWGGRSLRLYPHCSSGMGGRYRRPCRPGWSGSTSGCKRSTSRSVYSSASARPCWPRPGRNRSSTPRCWPRCVASVPRAAGWSRWSSSAGASSPTAGR